MRKIFLGALVVFAALHVGATPINADEGFVYDPLATPNPADYERLLLPLTTQAVHGQNGSFWTTELRIFNGSAQPVEMIGPSLEPTLVVDVQQTESEQIGPRIRGLDGAFLHVPKAQLATTKFSLRTGDASKGSGIVGANIPIVRESEAKQQLSFIDIPRSQRYRVTLRVYGWTEAPMQVGAKVFLEDGPTVRDQFTINLQGIVHVNPDPFPTHPSYAALNPLGPARPGIFPRARIELTSIALPGSTAPNFWAFISITDNVTGEVTIVTPQ